MHITTRRWLVVVGAVVAVNVAAGFTPALAQPDLAKLLADDGAMGDWFGSGAAVSGQVIVIGARYDDPNGENSGSGYVFRYDGSTWIQEAKLLPSDGAAYDQFGYATAISGEVAVIGALYNDDNGENSGSAYVFRYNGASWVQEAKLLPGDGAAYDQFGVSVALDGDVAVIGANGNDEGGSSIGAAYVFRYDGSTWSQEAKLQAADGAGYDQFGYDVDVDANTAIIGALYHDDGASNAGSAYVFRYGGTGWSQEAKLLASDGASADQFGWAVGVSGEVAVVGALNNDDRGSNSGSAYVFRYGGASWSQEAKLLASDGAAYDQFGYAVGVDGDTVVIGAIYHDDNGSNSGSAYVFHHGGTSWVQESKLLAPDGQAYDQFGVAVAISGDTAVIGAYTDDDNGDNSGSAYVFGGCVTNGTTGVVYRTIQAAIDAASAGDEVVVGAGTFTGSGNRDLDFGGKAITVRSTNPADPDVVAATIIDCQGTAADPHRGFYFHTNEGPSATVAGLTITNGRTDTYDLGGGIYCYIGARPTISDCVITGNWAYNGGGLFYYNSNAAITGCTISDNTAGASGGGIHCYGSSPTISNCAINDNTADVSGGGLYLYHLSSANVSNCTIAGNTANNSSGITGGGGAFCYDGSDAAFTNCTITGNTATLTQGGGVFSGYSSHVTLTNCILWDNAAPSGHEIALRTTAYPSAMTVSRCDVQGGQGDAHVDSGCTLTWGGGNIDDAPLFVDANDPDGPDDVTRTADDGLRIWVGGPCTDAADGDAAPAADILGNGRHDDPGKTNTGTGTPDYVDMGAYEFQGTSLPCALSLSVNWSPFGTVQVDPNQPTYTYGTLVTLTAEPGPGIEFVGWDGDVPGGIATDNPLQITMDGDKDIQAFFFPQKKETNCGAGGGLPLMAVIGLLGVGRLRRRR